MLVHSVYFWLKPGLGKQEQAAFREGLESLRGIPEVRALYVGLPAPTPKRPVIEDGYTFGLAVIFEDMAGHDVYQTHPLHQAFLARFAVDWDKVAIYDFV